ncbi:MAG: DUF6298 domain-containing protein, partial [Pirellulaceae bacterium]|nr:DUF6298 domain-containing protein [Pirellulaceae bacterium]
MNRLSARVLFLIAAIAIVLNTSRVPQLSAQDKNAERVQPYSKNPRYWQYKGEPVMLLGGSKTDHIFLLDDLKQHLDEMQEVGANYVRCTMSQREGLDLKPHKRLADGKFDLDQWNEEYWKRFADCLKWCDERDIIIQIEVWDRFDYSDHSEQWKRWRNSPWRPANNINYTAEQTGLADVYPLHPARDRQPFFHAIPGMKQYQKKYDLIRGYQERFVNKMLSHSLKFGNVLYCMNNETSTEPRWGRYWIQFIQAEAAERGVTVCTTDMFDDAFRGDKAEHTSTIFNDAEHYMFADISQVNSRNYDEAHWETLQWLLRQVDEHPRPSN